MGYVGWDCHLDARRARTLRKRGVSGRKPFTRPGDRVRKSTPLGVRIGVGQRERRARRMRSRAASGKLGASPVAEGATFGPPRRAWRRICSSEPRNRRQRPHIAKCIATEILRDQGSGRSNDSDTSRETSLQESIGRGEPVNGKRPANGCPCTGIAADGRGEAIPTGWTW